MMAKTESRCQEILDACQSLFEERAYKDITLKDIAQITSFSRPTIYNYFQTKEEIFLALLTREYQTWATEISTFKQVAPEVTPASLADLLSQSLAERLLMLKLIANNIADFEDHSRMANVVTFKKAYLATLAAMREVLTAFVPAMTASQQESFIYSFFPYLYGLYPYAIGTDKQKAALQELAADYHFYSVYDLVHRLLTNLLNL